jgi:HSP20 family protein
MTLVRWGWDPFRDLQSRVNRVFDDSVSTRGADDAYGTVWSPPVDIYEKDSNIVITAELPGLDPKDIKLSVEQNVLTLSGERRAQSEEGDGKQYHRRETYYGAFSRSFSLPRLVDRERIEAEYKNGILTVTVPQAPEARPRQIDVKVA